MFEGFQLAADGELDFPFYYDLIAGKIIKKQKLKQTKMVDAPNWR
jgi:hypothetical protein